MKLPSTKTSITTGILLIATAFTAGALVTHQPKTQRLSLASDTTTPAQTSTGTDSTTAPATSSPVTTNTSAQPATDTTTQTSSAASASSPTDQATTTNTDTTDQTPPATATSWTITDWSAHEQDPADPKEQVSYRYCVWTYSDGSTQQAVYQSRYIFPAEPSITAEISGVDCSVASAPTP